MKAIAKYKGFTFDRDGNIELTFTIDKRFYERVLELESTHENKFFDLITKHKTSQRTEEQNRTTWKLIEMICDARDGSSDTETRLEFYKQVIKESGIKSDVMQIQYYDEQETKELNKGIKCPETNKWLTEPVKTPLQMISTVYRTVEVAEIRENEHGKSAVIFCYLGLSHFNKEQNTRFIDKLLEYSDRHNLGVTIESEYLRRLLHD